jgi:N-acetyltransferase 10
LAIFVKGLRKINAYLRDIQRSAVAATLSGPAVLADRDSLLAERTSSVSVTKEIDSELTQAGQAAQLDDGERRRRREMIDNLDLKR